MLPDAGWCSSVLLQNSLKPLPSYSTLTDVDNSGKIFIHYFKPNHLCFPFIRDLDTQSVETLRRLLFVHSRSPLPDSFAFFDLFCILSKILYPNR